MGQAEPKNYDEFDGSDMSARRADVARITAI
jgi:hypothetical protein